MDGFLLDSHSDFEETMPFSIFKYSDVKDRDYDDFKLEFILQHHPKYMLANIHEVVTLKRLADTSHLEKRLKPPDAFQVIHISPRSNEAEALNQKVVEYWKSLL
jgi:hypothetical protein